MDDRFRKGYFTALRGDDAALVQTLRARLALGVILLSSLAAPTVAQQPQRPFEFAPHIRASAITYLSADLGFATNLGISAGASIRGSAVPNWEAEAYYMFSPGSRDPYRVPRTTLYGGLLKYHSLANRRYIPFVGFGVGKQRIFAQDPKSCFPPECLDESGVTFNPGSLRTFTVATGATIRSSGSRRITFELRLHNPSDLGDGSKNDHLRVDSGISLRWWGGIGGT